MTATALYWVLVGAGVTLLAVREAAGILAEAGSKVRRCAAAYRTRRREVALGWPHPNGAVRPAWTRREAARAFVKDVLR